MLTLSILSACATLRPPEPPPPAAPDWEAGFLVSAPPSAPIGPNEGDRPLFDAFAEIVATKTLDTPSAGDELGELAQAASQAMLSAMATSLFQAGVLEGRPQLIEISCAMEQDTIHSTLRRLNGLDALAAGCATLGTDPASLGGDACEQGSARALQGYRLLAADDEHGAREAIGSGLRLLRACDDQGALVGNPVSAASRGFLVVAVLQVTHAPESLWMRGMRNAPDLVAHVNSAFTANVKALGR